MDELRFLLALLVGREHAVFTQVALEIPRIEALMLALMYYWCLALAAIRLSSQPWVQTRVQRALKKKSLRWLRGIPKLAHGPAVCLACLLPSGFWISVFALSQWGYSNRLRVLILCLANGLSYSAYGLWAPVLVYLNPYLGYVATAAQAAAVVVGAVLAIRYRCRIAKAIAAQLQDIASWSLRRYRRVARQTI